MCDERFGYGGDNPGNLYSANAVNDREVYEITGNGGPAWHFNFNVFNWQPDGRYELLAIKNGGEPREGKWIA